MPSLLNALQKQKITTAFANLHDTFSRTITVYKNGQEVAIATSPQYNSFYNTVGTADSIEYTQVSASFDARIYYFKMDEEIFSNNLGAQVKIIMPEGSVKIVVDATGYEYIKEARKIAFDGSYFSIKSDGKPDGMFSNQYYTFYLTPTDE